MRAFQYIGEILGFLLVNGLVEIVKFGMCMCGKVVHIWLGSMLLGLLIWCLNCMRQYSMGIAGVRIPYGKERHGSAC